MVHLDKQEAQKKYETLDGIGFIEWVTDGYLAAIGGGLTADNMDMLSAEQHAVLCYRYVLDEVMEGGFIQLILNGYAPYVLEGPFPMVVKKEWGKEKEEYPLCPADISLSMGRPCGEEATSNVMKKFSKLLYEVKKEYHKHQEELSRDMSDEEFMALYEQLEELNELGDDFLDEHQEEVTPAVAKMIVENLDKYM
ncbi:MAG: DMP19 family protein [Bacteroidaceae bacterium]|nr:DMP19 family protein [Bacteroidaceae bacterium]